jgi:Raf kinase inhibitor-like YbhB/YbcL family protein
MLERAGVALAILALAACGTAAKDNRMNDNATIAKLALTSSDIANGQPIDTRYTCDGSDTSPALNWDEPPAGTLSFALVVDDPDAPSGLFRHWGAYDIPADTRGIDADQAIGRQAVNDFGKSGYGGPCPPPGHGPHHYHFKLFALDVDRLELGDGPKVADVESEAKKHALAVGEIVATFERK